MQTNPEWIERHHRGLGRGERRRDPWPEGYHMIRRASRVGRDGLIELARRFKVWPIPTQILPAFTPEEAATFWLASDEWVTDTSGAWRPPADYTGRVINPDGDLEERIQGVLQPRPVRMPQPIQERYRPDELQAVKGSMEKMR